MNDLRLIDNNVAETLISNYVTKVSNTADLFPWFSDPQDLNKKICYFQVGFPDFTILLSFPGATKCIFHFGLDTDNKIVLLMQLRNESGLINSGYMQLVNPSYDCAITEASSEDISYNKGGLSQNTAEFLIFYYEALMVAPLSPSFCQIKINETYTPLKSYTFDLSELEATLFITKEQSPGIGTWLMQVCFINHLNPFLELEHGSTIGLVVRIVNDSDKKPLSSFYDFSAPCPPTCSPS